MRVIAAFLIFLAGPAFGWGELGHETIARVAAELFPDDAADTASVVKRRALMLGLLANIPDVHWRNLDEGLGEDGRRLGDATHYFDLERMPPGAVPLDYEAARAALASHAPGKTLFKDVGTLPWRAQQFADLFAWAAARAGEKPCADLEPLPAHPTRTALGYAGLLSHYTGDVTMPFHSTEDFDGVATGEKGIHWYFESDVVEALSGELLSSVRSRARDFLHGGPELAGSVAWLRRKATSLYPPPASLEPSVAALIFAALADSHSRLDDVRMVDKGYAILPADEAKKLARCRGVSPCRRLPTDLVQGKPVAKWFAPLVIDRLAMAAALTSDVWARTWARAGKPRLCWTNQYALKPSFVSPTDEKCSGYATREGLAWKKPAAAREQCLTF